MDETILTVEYPVVGCWMKRGEQKRIPAGRGAKGEALALIGAYHWASDGVEVLPVERINSNTMIEFLEELVLHRYPDRPLVLVMDNASWHLSAAVRAWLSLVEHRLRVVYLPPYCPDLNVIERFWKHLKFRAAANRLYATLARLQTAVEAVIMQQNDPSCSDRLLFSKYL